MFHPLSGLFESKKSLQWGEDDIKHFVQKFLRDELHTDALYCQEVKGGRVVVCTSLPALQQEVRLLEYDLKEAVKQDTGYDIKEVKVVKD